MAMLVAAALLASCAAPNPNPTPGGPSFQRDDFRFVAPTGWVVRLSTEVSFGPARRVLYVANQPLIDDCVSDATGVVCHPPLEGALRAGGMLVTWVVQQCVAQGCSLPPGPLMMIGNRQGVRAAMVSGCDEIGFTERSAYYVTVTPQRIDVLISCARDPSDGTRSAFLGFLDAIQWRIP
jgi:hypothetical protein